MALHRLVEAAVGALGDDHVVVLGLPGLLQGRLLLLVARGHCSGEETGVSAQEMGWGWWTKRKEEQGKNPELLPFEG